MTGSEPMPWLLILIIVVPIFLLAINYYLVRVWGTSDDRKECGCECLGSSGIAQIVAVLGLLLCECSILLLPFDVANAGGSLGCGDWRTNKQGCGGLDLELVWQIVYLTILGFVTLIIPFAVFHYDAYDIDSKTAKMVGGGVRQCCRAIRWQFVSLVLATCFLIPMYVLLNKTSIPFTNIQVNVSQISAAGPVPVFGGAACVGGVACVEEKRKLAMQVTFPVYVMAMMSWVGWFFFVLYAGIGLITFPYDMFMSFTRRPRYMPVQEVLRYKGEVRSDAEKIIGIGQQMQHEMEEKAVGGGAKKRKMRKADRKTFNQFKQTVYALEMRYEDLKLVTGWEKSPSCGNTLAPWFNLLTGICCIIVSLAWLIHICLYMVPAVPVHPFLNDLLNTFSNIPELGSVFVGLFSFYLLICVVKGNFKFGMRFLLVSIHPMEYGNTLMSSFLVNISLILFACPAVVQFSVAAFKDYARLTDVEVIFGAQIKNLEFFNIFFDYNIFVYSLVAIAALTSIFMLCPCCARCNGSTKTKDGMKEWAKIEESWKKNAVLG